MGTVLVMGGVDGSTVLAGAELYNPTSGKFAATWTMSTARELTTATTLPDGSVLVSGGENSQSANPLLASAEVYPSPTLSATTAAAEFTVNNPVPVITGLSINPAPSGTQVTITGNNFVSSAEALLNGFAVPSYGNPSAPNSFSFYPSLSGTYSVAVNNPSPGGGVSNTVTLEVTVNVQISPARALWSPGSVNQFSATVLGTDNQGVTWSVQEGTTGGTVTSSGVYTASITPGTYHVIATSQADTTQSGSATVIVGPGAGRMTAGPQMVIARFEHTATLLRSGNVLIAGGDETGPGGTAEIYNPTTNTFTSTGSMSVPRWYHQASLLPSGKVLILCGFNYDNSDKPSPGAELYDPATGLFSSAGTMIDPVRDSCTSTTLSNGEVLVTGGLDANGNDTASAELYDPASGTFSVTGSMTTPRTGHTATLLNNGKVLIAGGGNSNGNLAIAELYDPSSGTFTATGSMTVPRVLATAVLMGNGDVMIMGQNTSYNGGPADVYSPSAGTFSQTSTPPVYPQASLLSAGLLPNGLELIAGGLLLEGSPGTPAANQTQFFDPNTGSFYAGPLMSELRFWNTMTVLQNGSVLIAGGKGAVNSGNTTDLYVPVATDPLP